MKLFDLPLHVGPVMSRLGESVALDVLDPSGLVVASFYGTEDLARMRAEWMCLHANARFAQLVPADNEDGLVKALAKMPRDEWMQLFGLLPADNELDERAYDDARDEARDAPGL